MARGISLLAISCLFLLALGTEGFASQEEITLEERIARIEGILEQMNERLNSLEAQMTRINERLDTLNTRLDKLINAFNARIDALHTKVDSSINGLREHLNDRFRWLLGFLGFTWATIVASTLAIVFTRRS
jgi:uncharacterized coiled-coil protein SlyX